MPSHPPRVLDAAEVEREMIEGHLRAGEATEEAEAAMKHQAEDEKHEVA